MIEIVVLSKYPTAGRVKTRLMPALSAEQAAAVHQACLLHLLPRLGKQAERVGGRVAVAYDPPGAGLEFGRLIEGCGVGRIFAQRPGDLGDRLVGAFEDAVQGGAGGVLFFGTDSPDVPDGAVQELMAGMSGHEVVIGPTEDGGYWAIGLRAGMDVAALFRGIPWSSGGEFAATVGRAREMGMGVLVGKSWPDVDRVEDLRELVRRVGESGANLGEDGDQRLRGVLLKIANQVV
jgi:rSAM/selenodomain-associated transferase 1